MSGRSNQGHMLRSRAQLSMPSLFTFDSVAPRTGTQLRVPVPLNSKRDLVKIDILKQANGIFEFVPSQQSVVCVSIGCNSWDGIEARISENARKSLLRPYRFLTSQALGPS